MTIGTILGVFLLVVAAFISYMESISYFDAFYACFITYSTIGFGDIDIYVIIVETSQTNRAIHINVDWCTYSASHIGQTGST